MYDDVQALPARSVLVAVGAVLLAIQGAIHLRLWIRGYREIAVIGRCSSPLGSAGWRTQASRGS